MFMCTCGCMLVRVEGGSVEGTLEKGYIDPLVRDHWLWHATTKSCFTRPFFPFFTLSSPCFYVLSTRSILLYGISITYFSYLFFILFFYICSCSFSIYFVFYLFSRLGYMFYYFASSFMTLDEGYVVGCCHYSKDSGRCYLIDVRNTVSKILAAAMLLLLLPLNVSLIDPGPATLPYDPKLRSTSFFCVHCHLIDPTGIYFSQSESLRFALHRTTS